MTSSAQRRFTVLLVVLVSFVSGPPAAFMSGPSALSGPSAGSYPARPALGDQQPQQIGATQDSGHHAHGKLVRAEETL
ncbi:hypothetical protein SY2F82_51880 [Streptomyces sp. Y2F8-2]|nr:hypothetical protein SY2F82_51880 [Streptomyces sp. Y2F8-2]